MNENRHITNLALVGFMGSGKSTVGHLLAMMLGFEFVDTDDMIERQVGKKITEIFATEGEEKFRLYERQILEQLATAERSIISTGGGLVTRPGNLELLQQNSLVVCLWASAETIFNRVAHQTHRPLLVGEDPKGKIVEMLKARAPFYRQADVLVSSDFRSPREVAIHIVHQFRLVQPGVAAK
ncbi:MAG: shikimate kinase [Verrucomicrobiales bacterium]